MLGGLVRDTIARVHGTFGAAASSIGFAGARVLGNQEDGGIWREQWPLEGERRGTGDLGSCQALCTILCRVSSFLGVSEPEPEVCLSPNLSGELIPVGSGQKIPVGRNPYTI